MKILKDIPEDCTVIEHDEDLDEDVRYIDHVKYDVSELHEKMLETCLIDGLDMNPISVLMLIENGFEVSVVHASAWEAAVQITVPGMTPPLVVIAIA